MPRREKKTPRNKVLLGIGDKNDKIQTPPSFLEALNKIHHFDFDPCPLEMPAWDGLKAEWGKSNWVNPPFSEIAKWLKKGTEEKEKGNKSLFLITLRSTCKYWRKFIWPFATDFILLENNVKFVGFERAFPVPLCLIEFDPSKPLFPSFSLPLEEGISLRYLREKPVEGG